VVVGAKLEDGCDQYVGRTLAEQMQEVAETPLEQNLLLYAGPQAIASSNALASCKSHVSNPSVNQL
jgi:hypothetical protein